MPISLAALRVELLGKLRLCAGERQTSRFETRRTALLLARLALPPLRSWPREELIELLWPDEDPAATRVRFRQTLASLRRSLEELGIPQEQVLKASRATVELDVEQVISDVVELESCLRRARLDSEGRREALDRALELYEHHLLPGYYETWVLSERDRLANALRDALGRLSQDLIATEPEAAVLYARRAVTLDPLSESAQEQYLKILVGSGRSAEATRHLKEVERLFWKELRTLPPDSLKATLTVRPPAAPPSAVTTEPVPSPPSPATVASQLPRTLPTPLDRFFGRDDERQRLVALLSEQGAARLVTISGPPGVGKTRLALEVGHLLEQESPERNLLFLSVEQFETGEAVLSGLLEAAGGRQERGAVLPTLATLLSAHRKPLLILDNAEGVRELGGALHRLLQAVPELRCLVTSQHALMITGEHELVLEPLSPEAHARELLIDRAQRLRPGLVLTEQNAAELTALCQELDGLPLALELAAGWLGMLSPDQVRSRLQRDPRLLVRRSVERGGRHASLHAALEESIARLTPEQQAILMRLSVFPGGWTLEAAEQVCEELSAVVLLDLETLRTASLVSAYTLPDGELRFRMLETIRTYARLRQEAAGRQEAQESHLRYFCKWVETLEGFFHSPEQYRFFEGMALEQENVQSALEYARESSPTLGARLAVAYWRYWDRRGQHEQGVSFLEAFLAHLGDDELHLRARVEEALGRLLYSQLHFARSHAYYRQSQEDFARAGDAIGSELARCAAVWAQREADLKADLAPLLEECLEVWRLLEDCGTLPQKGMVAGACGSFYTRMGDYQQARQFLEQSLAIWRIVGNQRNVFLGLHLLAHNERCCGDLRVSLQLEREAMLVARQIGDDFAVAIVLWNLYDTLLELEAYDEAESYACEGLTLTRQCGMAGSQPLFLVGLARACAGRGEIEAARRWFRQGLRQAEATGEQVQLLVCTHGLVRLALEEAQKEPTRARQVLAAQLWGVLQRQDELIQPRQHYSSGGSLDEALARLTAALGEETFAIERDRARHYDRAAALQFPLLYPQEHTA